MPDSIHNRRYSVIGDCMNTIESLDYEALGLRCGLEVHYQLDTKKKLFCHCPVGLLNRSPDAQLVRHMRPTLSELGEYDGTALMEFKTKKEVHYQLYYDSVCTYEMDDTPPFVINEEALDIAIEIALLLNCQIADEVHVSRKQYLDGSIPTGFQRTIAVGINGWLPFGKRKIRVVQVCLEEDACREISDRGHVIVFRTDRLSIPLVEVITAPEMRTPSEACKVGREIGAILRATGKVRRGIGTVRQDVNVSISGGTRVEIKGVPKSGMITSLVGYEAYRQKRLLSLKRRIDTIEKGFSVRSADCTDLFSTSECGALRSVESLGLTVSGIMISGFCGLLNWPVSPGRTFGDELAGRVRVIACLDDEPVLFLPDSRSPHGPSEEEWRRVRERLKATADSAVLLVRGPKEDVETAVSEIAARVSEAKTGIPGETRQALKGGETDFERILPGPDRMYPDTDSTPIPVNDEKLERIQKRLPVTPSEWRQRCKNRLKPQTIDQLIDMDLIATFWRVLSATGCDPKLLAYTLSATLVQLRKAGHDVSSISEEALVMLFRLHKEGGITREKVPGALQKLSSGLAFDDLVAAENVEAMDEHDLKSLVKATAERTGEQVKDAVKRRRYLIGILKQQTENRVGGKRITEIVRNYCRP